MSNMSNPMADPLAGPLADSLANRAAADTMLARLIAQAQTSGADLVTLRAIVEEASDHGAARVLARLGLSDPTAHEDLSELRELLRAWRDAKASAWKAVIDWTVRGLLAALLIGIAVRLGLWEMVR